MELIAIVERKFGIPPRLILPPNEWLRNFFVNLISARAILGLCYYFFNRYFQCPVVILIFSRVYTFAFCMVNSFYVTLHARPKPPKLGTDLKRNLSITLPNVYRGDRFAVATPLDRNNATMVTVH